MVVLCAAQRCDQRCEKNRLGDHAQQEHLHDIGLPGPRENKQGIIECKRNRMCLILCDVSFIEPKTFRRCVTQRVDYKRRLI